MEKSFKDYAHLYLGCDVLVQNLDSDDFETEIEEGITNGCVAKLTLVNQGGCQLRAYDDSENWEYAIEIEGAYLCSWWSSRNVKPLLRPLSDMTNDESLFLGREIFRWTHPSNESVSFQTKDLLGTNKFYVNQTNITGESWTKATIYLLKQGFDLFGLIEAGVAIAKEPATQIC